VKERKIAQIQKNKEKEGKELMNAKAGATQATRIDVIEQNASLKSKTQDVIRFPFIVVMNSSSENSMNLNMDTSQKKLSIESKKEFNIFGDIDVLLKMKLHQVSKQFFEKEIPKDLRKYISQSFMDSLY